VYWLNPQYFWWLTPILIALVLSVPLSIFVSGVRWGERARAAGLFLIPEETDPPPELRDLHAVMAEAASHPVHDGFVRAIVDPEANALHRGLLRGARQRSPAIGTARHQLVERALRTGPGALALGDRRVVLLDPDATDALHAAVWALPEERFADWLSSSGMVHSPPSGSEATTSS
jgi:membrane glycosyltransferase